MALTYFVIFIFHFSSHIESHASTSISKTQSVVAFNSDKNTKDPISFQWCIWDWQWNTRI